MSVIGTRASIAKNLSEKVAKILSSYKPNFTIIIVPNTTTPEPKLVRGTQKSGIPTVVRALDNSMLSS